MYPKNGEVLNHNSQQKAAQLLSGQSLLYLVDDKDVSRNYINQIIKIIKLAYQYVLKNPCTVSEIPRPKEEKKTLYSKTMGPSPPRNDHAIYTCFKNQCTQCTVTIGQYRRHTNALNPATET